MFGLNRRQLLSLLVLIALLFAATQYIPPYFYALQFNDFIRQEVKFAVTARKTTDEVRTNIIRKAQEFNIALTERDIKVTRRGPSFTVDLEYRFPINMRAYQHELVFRANESGEIFEDAAP